MLTRFQGHQSIIGHTRTSRRLNTFSTFWERPIESDATASDSELLSIIPLIVFSFAKAPRHVKNEHCYDRVVSIIPSLEGWMYCTSRWSNPLVGGETVIEKQVNVAELADRCCKAHIVTLTITPKSKNIDIDITKGDGSHGLPILSLIQIQPSTDRRLNVECCKEAVYV